MSEQETDGLKLLITYNMKPDVTQEYFHFMLRRYVPLLQTRGVSMTIAWHTAYGDYPNRLLEFVARDPDKLWALLASDHWRKLNRQLDHFVTDFNFKVVRYKEEFQLP